MLGPSAMQTADQAGSRTAEKTAASRTGPATALRDYRHRRKAYEAALREREQRRSSWLRAGICATVGANLAHEVGHGPVGALVSAWPALALVGSFELLMMLIRTIACDLDIDRRKVKRIIDQAA